MKKIKILVVSVKSTSFFQFYSQYKIIIYLVNVFLFIANILLYNINHLKVFIFSYLSDYKFY